MGEKGDRQERQEALIIGINTSISSLAESYGKVFGDGARVAVTATQALPQARVFERETLLLVSGQEDGEAKIVQMEGQKKITVWTVNKNGNYRKKVYLPRHQALELIKSYQRPEKDDLVILRGLVDDARVGLAQQSAGVTQMPGLWFLINRASGSRGKRVR